MAILDKWARLVGKGKVDCFTVVAGKKFDGGTGHKLDVSKAYD